MIYNSFVLHKYKKTSKELKFSSVPESKTDKNHPYKVQNSNF
jgi:hypothetical protein